MKGPDPRTENEGPDPRTEADSSPADQEAGVILPRQEKSNGGGWRLCDVDSRVEEQRRIEKNTELCLTQTKENTKEF